MPRLTPFDVGEEKIDYDKLMREFGTQPISQVAKLPSAPAFKRGIVFSHRDFDKFLTAARTGKKVSILTGFNASGSIHLGHKQTFDTVIALQKELNVPVYIPITDDEAYVTGKIDSLEEGLKNARLIAAQMIALGFDMSKTRIFIHQLYPQIYNLGVKLSKKCTLSEIKAIYGFTDSTNAGLMFYPCMQAADIILPQDLLGKHIVLVPIGIDQDPHVRLARDLADRSGYVKPAAIHFKYFSGMSGGPKMSKSKPGSTIFLDEDPDKAAKYCMSAFTGGRATVEEQKRLGGEPDKCVVFEYLGAHFMDDKELKELESKCRGGKIMCGECKKLLASRCKQFLIDFQAKVKKAEKEVDKYLLK